MNESCDTPHNALSFYCWSISSHLCTPFQLISMFLGARSLTLQAYLSKPCSIFDHSRQCFVTSKISDQNVSHSHVCTEITSGNIQEEVDIPSPPGLVREQINKRKSSFLSSYSSKVTTRKKNAQRAPDSRVTMRTSNGILMVWVIDYSTGLINPTVNIKVAVRNITGVCFCSLQPFLMDQKNPSISRLWPGDRSIHPCQSSPSTDMIYGFGHVWLAQVPQRRRCAAANKWWCWRPEVWLFLILFTLYFYDTFMMSLLFVRCVFFNLKVMKLMFHVNTWWQRPWDP